MTPRFNRFALFAWAVLVLSGSVSSGQELLQNGDFELGELEVFPGWEIAEFVNNTGMDPINAVEVVGFANEPGDTPGGNGLWLRGFVGGVEATGYAGANAIVTQVVPVAAGNGYTLTGHSNFEANYSGGVSSLDSTAPLSVLNGSPALSPTQSLFEIEFLDASGAVIGAAASHDLVNDGGQSSGGGWLEHTLQAIAPAGSVQARVLLKAVDMVANGANPQSGFYDNFSFTDSAAPAIELLINGGVNEIGTEIPEWTFDEQPAGADTLALAGFANNTPAGANGVWIRGFVEGSGTVSQTVEGVAGTEYVFAASSLFEPNYPGGLAGTGTETMLELAFLDGAHGVLGAPVLLDLRTEQINGMGWADHVLTGVAPAGTAYVRVAGVVTGLSSASGPQLSAFLDDFSLRVVPEPSSLLLCAALALGVATRRARP